MNRPSTKMIRVTSRGSVLTSRGMVITPILNPYREKVSRIWEMMTRYRATVEEKLDNGEYLVLTLQNFDKNNNAVDTSVPIAPAVSGKVSTTKSQPEQEPDTSGKEILNEVVVKKEELSEEIPTKEVEVKELDTVTEETPVETVTTTATDNSSKKKNRNKGKSNNRNNKSVEVTAEEVE